MTDLIPVDVSNLPPAQQLAAVMAAYDRGGVPDDYTPSPAVFLHLREFFRVGGETDTLECYHSEFGDGTGNYRGWDVGIARALLARKPREPEPVPVAEHAEKNYTPVAARGGGIRWRGDPAYAMALPVSRLSVPIIVVEYREAGEAYGVIIDGNHRMYRAWRDGRETVPAYVLSRKESLLCMIPDEVSEVLRRADGARV